MMIARHSLGVGIIRRHGVVQREGWCIQNIEDNIKGLQFCDDGSGQRRYCCVKDEDQQEHRTVTDLSDSRLGAHQT